MSDLSHPADPGFRVIQALMRARDAHRAIGRLLPDWPPLLKDVHEAQGRALAEAWLASWDAFCEDNVSPDIPAENPGKDATVAGDEFTVSRELSTIHEIPCNAALCHDFAPPPDGASAHDDPPSKPIVEDTAPTSISAASTPQSARGSE